MRRAITRISKKILPSRSLFRFSVPLLNDTEHYRELLRKEYEWDEQARSSFVRNTLLGNAAGLLAIASLLSKWPDTAALVEALIPAGMLYAIGTCAAASTGLFQRSFHHRMMVIMGWRVKLLDEVARERNSFSNARKRLITIRRRVRRGRTPAIMFAGFFVALGSFLLGTVFALAAVALTPRVSHVDPARDQRPPAAKMYQLQLRLSRKGTIDTIVSLSSPQPSLRYVPVCPFQEVLTSAPVSRSDSPYCKPSARLPSQFGCSAPSLA
jgi:hypothetical protein